MAVSTSSWADFLLRAPGPSPGPAVPGSIEPPPAHAETVAVAGGETIILLRPRLPFVGVSIVMEIESVSKMTVSSTARWQCRWTRPAGSCRH